MSVTTKKGSKEKVKEAFKLIEQGIEEITSSEKYKEFLAFTARFYNYSFRNQLLIWIQKPNATFVAGYKEWQKMGRYVRKGEKGIQILAPMRIKTKKENEVGEEEEKEILLYKSTYVFDISQTEGEPVPTLGDLVQTVPGETELYGMVKQISPFPVEELDDCEGADGYFRVKEQDIKIYSKNPPAHKLLTLIHEIAHGLLHNDRKNLPDKRVREIEAECVGYTVCHALGIDTSVNSFGYLVSYGGNFTKKLVKESRERIQRAANTILSKFEETFLLNDDEENDEKKAIS